MAAESVSGSWGRLAAVSIAIAAALYLAVTLASGYRDVMAAIDSIGGKTILTVLALTLVGYGLRALRWHFLLRRLGYAVPLGIGSHIYLAGFALTATPGKTGEAARGLWLKAYGVPLSASIAALIAERVQDVAVMAALCVVGLSFLPVSHWLIWLSLSVVCGLLLLCMQGRWLERAAAFFSVKNDRLSLWMIRLMTVALAFRQCLTPSALMGGLLCGTIAWSAEAYGFALLLDSLHHPINWEVAFSIYAFSMLAGAASFMPGGLGSFEAVMVLLLSLVAIPLPVAVSATLLIRLATLWFAVGLGVAAMLCLPSRRERAVSVATGAIDVSKSL